MVSGLAHEIKLPDGIDLSMEFMLQNWSPFHKAMATKDVDRDEMRAYVKVVETAHDSREYTTEAYTGFSKLVRGVRVLYGTRFNSDSGWTRYAVVSRKNGLTLTDARKIADEFGVTDEYRYSGPGRPYTHPGGLARKSRTRWVFTQSGGLDI